MITIKDIANFATKADTGMMILITNVVGLLWYCAVTGHHLPEGTSVIVLGIFAGKTTHGIMSPLLNGHNGNGNGKNGHK